MHWKEKPVLFPTVTFLMGTIVCYALPNCPTSLLIGLLAIVWVGILALSKRERFPILRFALLAVGFFLSGFLSLAKQIPASSTLQAFTKGKNQFALVIEEKLKPNENWKKYRGLLLHPNKSKISILLYLKEDLPQSERDLGDTLILQGELRLLSQNPNPTLFDYGKYLKKKGVYLQFYAKHTSQILQINSPSKKELSLIERIQQSTIRNLTKSFKDPEDLAFQKAILLGQSSDLSPQMMESFRKSGAVHVLAISGLHVGILTGMISKILKSLFRNKFRLLQLFLQLMALWIFVLTAGAKPSVLRAGIMFTAYTFAEKSHRKLDPVQSLSLAALIIVLLQPLQVFDLGFQLSFAAVLGIVLFFPSLSGLFPSGNKIVRFIWEGLAIALAAQVATLPILLFNFKEISTIFWLSGLLVVPLMGILLPCSILNILISFLAESLMPLSSIVCEGIMWLMTQINETLADFSFSYLQGLPFDGINLLILVLLIGTLLVPFYNRRYLLLMSFLLTIAMFAYEGYKRIFSQRQEWILQYADDRQHLMQWTRGQSYVLFADKPLNFPLTNALEYQEIMRRTDKSSSEIHLISEEKFHWAIDSHHWTNYCPEDLISPLSGIKIGYLFWWGNRSIIEECIFESIDFHALVLPMGISQDSRKEWSRLADKFHRKIIFQDITGPFFLSLNSKIKSIPL